MKNLSLILIALLAFTACNKQATTSRAIDETRVAVVFTSDDANSVAGAAIVATRYFHTTLINIDNKTSDQSNLLISSTDSVHKFFVLVDTITAWATNKLAGIAYDTVVEQIYKDTLIAIMPDADWTYPRATATKNLAEVVWETCFPTVTTKPLVIQYLGDDIFSLKVTRSKNVNTDSTAVDSTGSLTANAFDNDWVYIYSGTGKGQYRQIYDNNTTTYFVTPDWAVRPDKTSLLRIKNNGEQNEVFYDQYASNYIYMYLTNLSDVNVFTNWGKLMDRYGNINDGNVRQTPLQDLDYLNNTVLAGGKIIFDYGVYQEDD